MKRVAQRAEQEGVALSDREIAGATTPCVRPAPLLVDLAELARLLSISVSSVERLVREGMPALDLAEHNGRCRPKRLLRFIPGDCIDWIRQRGNGGGGDGR